MAEIALLLENILEESPGMVRMTIDWIAAGQPDQPRVESCES